MFPKFLVVVLILFTSNDSLVEGQLGQGFQNTRFTKRPEKFLVI